MAAIMAFGAGILISALSFELVEDACQKAGFFPMAAGSILGGALFVVLNRILNGMGAFGRKQSTTKKFAIEKKKREAGEIVDRLSRIELLRHLPLEDIDLLLPGIETLEMKAGTVVFREGQEPDGLYLIEKGEVEVLRGMVPADTASGDEGDDAIAVLGAGDTFGEMSMLAVGAIRGFFGYKKADSRVP